MKRIFWANRLRNCKSGSKRKFLKRIARRLEYFQRISSARLTLEVARPDSPTLLLHSPPIISSDLHTQQSVVSAARLSALSSNSRLKSPRNVESGCDHLFELPCTNELICRICSIGRFGTRLPRGMQMTIRIQMARIISRFYWFCLRHISSVSEDEWFGIESACCNWLQIQSVSTRAGQRRSFE